MESWNGRLSVLNYPDKQLCLHSSPKAQPALSVKNIFEESSVSICTNRLLRYECVIRQS